MSSFQFLILKLISANDGRFSWYQLDRQLTNFEEIDPAKVTTELMPTLAQLEYLGLITAVSENSMQPLYSITQAGKETLDAHRD